MAVPDFLAYTKPVASPLQAAIQGGLGTYGSLQQLHLQKQQAAQQAASQQLQQQIAQEKLREMPGTFATAQRTAAAQQALSLAKIKQFQSGLGGLTGVAEDSDSMDRYLKVHPANTVSGSRALNKWDSGVDMQKARTLYMGSNYWLKNLTPLRKEQFYKGLSDTNARLIKAGQPVLNDRQYAQSIGMIPSEQVLRQQALLTHVQEIQGQQGRNGLPIQHPAAIIAHLTNNVPAHQIAAGNVPPLGITPQPGMPQPGGQQPIAPSAQPLPPQAASQTGATQVMPSPQPGIEQLRTAPPQMGSVTQPVPQPGVIPAAAAGPAAAMVKYPAPLTGAQAAQIAPVDYGARATQMGLSILGRTSDAKNRSKVIYGNQSEITIGNMQKDVHAMYAYSGPEGKTKLLKDQAVMAATGKASPEYMAYQRFITNAKVLQGQIIQYYGQSVQPVQQEEIRSLTDPSNWINNPKTTHEKWDAFTKTLSQEIALRRHALQDPSAYFSAPKQKVIQYTDSDYKTTAAKYGMTVPELKAYIKKTRGPK